MFSDNTLFLGDGIISRSIRKGLRSRNSEAILIRVTEHSYSRSLERLTKNDFVFRTFSDVPESLLSKISLVVISWRERHYFDDQKLSGFFLKERSFKDFLVINLSSAAVYGECELAKDENDKLLPINKYGEDKVYIEDYLIQFRNISIVSLRIANILSYDMPESLPALLVRSIHLSESVQVPPLRDFGRDYITLSDFLDVFFNLLLFLRKTAREPLPKILNLSSGKCTTLQELICEIQEFYDLTIKIVPRNFHSGEIHQSTLSPLRIDNLLKSQNISAHETIRRFLLSCPTIKFS
jgi:hypothetical protein